MIKKIVITGAPSTGKTSLIHKLQQEGFICIPEISREIVSQQIAIEGEALPWKNLAAFSKQVAVLRKAQFINATKNSTHFFDRGLIDVVAYMNIDKLEIPEFISDFLNKNKYHSTVFITPIWEEIFENDRERKENIEQAILIEKQLKKCYQSFGYDIIEIPKLSIEERVNFIISHIK